jgi:hypothetical protein
LNSVKVRPKALPISGSFLGPKIIKAMTSIKIKPGIPILDNMYNQLLKFDFLLASHKDGALFHQGDTSIHHSGAVLISNKGHTPRSIY